MFGLFSSNNKNAIKKLDKHYHSLLKQAMEAQRAGNIQLYSEISEQADSVFKEMENLKSINADN